MSYTMSTEDIARTLYDMNKTYDGQKSWEKMFQTVDAAENMEQSALAYNYADAIGSAYASSLQNRNNSSVLFGDQSSVNDLNLSKAFDEYRKNYLSGQQSISSAYNEQRNTITSSLQTQAQNMESYRRAHYAYLKSLAEKFPSLYENAEFANYFATDDEGKTYLKGENALFAPGVFQDYEGNLTELGKDFYRQMLTYGSSKDDHAYTFQDFLNESEEYKGLADWAMSESADAGYTNRDVFMRDILGIDLSDILYNKNSVEKYDRYLREGVINQEQYDALVSQTHKLQKSANTADYQIVRLGTDDEERFKVTIGGESFKLKAEGDVSDDIKLELNKLSTGDADKNPNWNKEPLVVYKGKMYVYTAHGWKNVIDRKDKVDDAVAKYLETGSYDSNVVYDGSLGIDRSTTKKLNRASKFSLGSK